MEVLDIDRVQDWMNNEWAYDVTVGLKVTPVPPEAPTVEEVAVAPR